MRRGIECCKNGPSVTQDNEIQMSHELSKSEKKSESQKLNVDPYFSLSFI